MINHVVGVMQGFQILHCMFCIVAEVEKLSKFNQSVHYQPDRIKNCRHLEIPCYWFIFIRWAQQVRIFPC